MTRILVVGKSGQVGWELPSALAHLGHVTALDRGQMDLEDPNAIRKAIRQIAPEIIVNAAGYTTVDKAEAEPYFAIRVNTNAPGVMAEEAKRSGALLVHYSTDYVYDGAKGAPYDEDDEPNPLNVYGRSKLDGERAILDTGCAHLILRASWIYSDRGTNFVTTMLRLAREKRGLSVVDDQVGSPACARALAKATADILATITHPTKVSGIYHLSSSGHTTRFDFAKMIIALAKKSSGPDATWAAIHATTTANYPLPAARPLYAASSKAKIKRVFGVEMASWQDQIRSFIERLPGFG